MVKGKRKAERALFERGADYYPSVVLHYPWTSTSLMYEYYPTGQLCTP